MRLVYQFLLRFYPASFREDYGEEMYALWRQRRRDASGPLAIVALWIATFFESLANAAAVHWDILRQDLRYAVRTLAASPGFALTAILVLALGIGANTAAFSVTDFVLVRPLPYRDPDRLIKIWETTPGYSRMEFSPANFRDFQRRSRSVESMGAMNEILFGNLIGIGDPQNLQGAAVTAEVLPLLGIPPLMGRLFTAADDRAGAAGTVIVSYGLWQGLFGGEPGILGRKVTLDNEQFTVVGVMPRDFHFPRRGTEFWRTTRFKEDDYQERNNNYLTVIARLRPGVSLGQARAEMKVLMQQLRRQFPAELEHTGATAIDLHAELSEQSRLLLLALSAAALCVLLIACANLANLMLVRALARGRELAVRAAMGAGSKRLVRQMVTESVVLAALGALAGVAISQAAVPLLTRLVPNSLPIAQRPSLDWRLLGFAALVTGVTVVGFALLPASRACRNADLSALRDGARSGGGRKERLRAVLVVAEVSASVVLLVSAGLLLRAMWRVQAIDPGFRADGVLTLKTELPQPKYESTQRRAAFYSTVLSQIRALPGVRNAAYISFLPMAMGGGIWPVAVGGSPQERSEAHTASLRFVTPGFFSTMQIPLNRGRDVAESDTAQSPYVAVVSQSFVERYWPGQDALGRHFQFALHDRTVVGVVHDIRVRGLEHTSEPQVYVPQSQMPDGEMVFYSPQNLVIRSSGSYAALMPAVRRIIHAADAEQPISDVRPMSEIVEDQTASRRAQVRVLAAFAALAFLLAGLGIHGMLAFAVSRRRQEIGVRVALGARPGSIIRMIVRQGIFLAVAGILPGMLLAYAAARALGSLLAGVRPADVLTFGAAIGLCAVMTVLGSLLPAIRAVRIHPMSAIRTE